MKSSILVFLIIVVLGEGSLAADFKDRKVVSIGYFNRIYGHVHKNPFRYSLGLTTISCGHPMKILKVRNDKESSYQEVFAKNWRYTKVGPYHGYIHEKFISLKKPRCFQDKYSKFFEKLDLEISDMYYWGKLYDQYILGKTRVR